MKKGSETDDMGQEESSGQQASNDEVTLLELTKALKNRDFAPGQAKLATTDLARAVYEQITNTLTLLQGNALMGDFVISEKKWQGVKSLAQQWLEDIQADKSSQGYQLVQQIIQRVESEFKRLWGDRSSQ